MNDLISRQAAIDIIEAGRLTKLIDAETAVNGLKGLPSAQLEPTTEIQEILNYLDTTLHPIVSPYNWNVYAELHDMVSKLPSAQPEIIRCKDCKHKGTKNCVANAWTTIFGFGVKDDFYCGLAERVFNE